MVPVCRSRIGSICLRTIAFHTKPQIALAQIKAARASAALWPCAAAPDPPPNHHHHATLCIAAYGFLIAERGALPPSGPPLLHRSRDLPFPTVTDAEAPPIRPERHIPNSIATMRRRRIVALAKTLPRCPCCNAPIRKTLRIPDY